MPTKPAAAKVDVKRRLARVVQRTNGDRHTWNGRDYARFVRGDFFELIGTDNARLARELEGDGRSLTTLSLATDCGP